MRGVIAAHRRLRHRMAELQAPKSASKRRETCDRATHFLSRDAYACVAGGYWIILDAERDQYLCLAEEPLSYAGHRLHGWTPMHKQTAPLAPTERDADALIESLLSRGILTNDPQRGKPFACTCFDPPTSDLPLAQRAVRRRDLVRLFPGFLRAMMHADYRLRVRSIRSTIQAVELRRLRHGGRAETADYDRVAALVSAFRTLRPLYPRRVLCLFDSLALLDFLLPHRLFPHWVFGVVADPFSAHCWLQMGSVVINDDIDRVRRHTPIMVK